MAELKGYTLIESLGAMSITLFVFVASLFFYLQIVHSGRTSPHIESNREIKRIAERLKSGETQSQNYELNSLLYEVQISHQGNLTIADIEISKKTGKKILTHRLFISPKSK